MQAIWRVGRVCWGRMDLQQSAVPVDHFSVAHTPDTSLSQRHQVVGSTWAPRPSGLSMSQQFALSILQAGCELARSRSRRVDLTTRSFLRGIILAHLVSSIAAGYVHSGQRVYLGLGYPLPLV